MNPFLLPPRERLCAWKTLRNGLAARSEDEQLQQVVEFWAQCPLQKFALDTEAPQTWPTPWQLIHQNDFDRNAVALGMEMTLRLAGWDADRLTLMMVHDPTRSERLMVVKIDDQKLLNYHHRMVCQFSQTILNLLYAYQFNGRVYASASQLNTGRHTVAPKG